LGLTIDEKLDWKLHTSKVANKIAPFVGILRRIRPFINEKTAFQIYFSYIHSRLSYCLPIWSSCSVERKIKLQILQNKAVKAILLKPSLTPTSDLYNNKFLSFLQLCEYDSILFIHKVKNGMVRCDVNLTTNAEHSKRLTRQSNLLRPPRFLTSSSQNSIFYRGINLYNKFCSTENLKKIKTLSDLKTKIKLFVSKNID
jgi:hypothetical protein